LEIVMTSEYVTNAGLPTAKQKLMKPLSGPPVSYGNCAVKVNHGRR